MVPVAVLWLGCQSVDRGLSNGHSYATDFPRNENPISESGRWINGGTVGLDWTDVSSNGGLAIGHEVGASYTDATALLTGAWGPNQMAEAVVHTIHQNDGCYQELELRLRSAIGPHLNRGYEITFRASKTSEAYVFVTRWNGPVGDFTDVLAFRGAMFGIATGDTMRARMIGHVITVYRNGVQMLQATDSTWSDGSPGMGFNLENKPAGCTGTNGDYGFTHFAATDSLGPF